MLIRGKHFSTLESKRLHPFTVGVVHLRASRERYLLVYNERLRSGPGEMFSRYQNGRIDLVKLFSTRG
jgi:hypothetical protein